MENLALNLLATSNSSRNPYIVCRNTRSRRRELRIELFNRENRSRSYKVWVSAAQGWSVANVLTVIDGGRPNASR